MRVHQLAKSLDVTSKDIIGKCEAEGIPGISNHMSTVSAGLAATIKEWFSTSGGEEASTATETAAPVDIDKVRARAKRKTRKKPVEPEKAKAQETPTKMSDSPAAPVQASTPMAPVPSATQEPAPAAPEVKVAPPVAPPAPEVEPPAKPPEVSPEEPAIAASTDSVDDADGDAPKAVMNVPNRPDVIAPVGRKLQSPSKMKLSGPKVIRVETPDPVSQPRPRSGGDAPRRDAPRGGQRGGPPTEMPPDQPPMVGRGGQSGSSRRNKRRTTTPTNREGRSGRFGAASDTRSFNWREQDLLERERRLNRAGGYFRAARRDNLKRSAGGGQRAQTASDADGPVKVNEPVTVKDLSFVTGIKASMILKQLFIEGNPTTINDVIDAATAVEVMLHFDVELEVVEQKTAEAQIEEKFLDRNMHDEQSRSPVVTILGHVDHGKTSLLDNIRNAKVADGEAGGITQATSAFRVPVQVGEEEHLITFIDTPGHEAFTEMRARGAKVTDMVVLVVAADDGVMPQTIESINHAQAAGVPIVVALNKMDKPEATDNNIQRILGQLAEHQLNPVEWGGDTEVVRTTATTGEGITELLETLDYQAQLLELKADFAGPAEGSVIESQVIDGRGAVARVLVQQGLLKKGDFIVVGRAYGRVRDIVDDRGKQNADAGPSTPVAFSGINEVPDAGDKFYVVGTLKEAEAAASERVHDEREASLVKERVTLDNIFEKLAVADQKELPLIVKADVQGSVETLKATLGKISGEKVGVSVKHAGVGGVNESDIALAEAAQAIIIGFNVTAPSKVRRQAEERGVDIRFYDVIYDITDDVTRAAEGLLDPALKLEVLGHAEVREVFRISKVGMVAGCYVTDGVIERNAQIRVTRDDIVVEKDRRLEQLKRFKDDAKEVRSGQECGMLIDGYDDIKVGDILECYRTQEVRQTL